jgi:CubicO group peptidase (beta-lactamase class C family)
VDQDTAFEIGSVTKGLTGLLLADQVHAGRTSLEAPFGRARLEDLATHSAGLPRLPTGTVLRALPAAVSGGDPYRGTAEQVLAQARGAGPRSGAGPRYSNLGAAAAGDLLAQDAGTTYPQLLRERVLSPLGMTGTVVVTDDTGLPGHRATGSTASGVPRAPWIASGWAPAGIGVWSTSADLAALVRALAAGTAPGQSAVVPRRDFTGGERIGLFWRTLSLRGQRVTFHNGESGGMSAFVGFAPDTGRGIVVLTNTAKNVDAEALRLLLSGAGR